MTSDCSKTSILQDVVAFVNVWSSNRTENYSKSFEEDLVDMGARVLKYFNKHVTHVVFKDGHESVWKKAQKTGVKLVSVLWVERCLTTHTHVDESLFPAINESKHSPKNKRTHRCMKPKDFIEKTPTNNKRLKKKLDQMIRELDLKRTTGADLNLLSLEEDAVGLYNSNVELVPFNHFCGMEKRLKEMKEKRENPSPTASQMSQLTSASALAPCQPDLGESPSSFAKALFAGNPSRLRMNCLHEEKNKLIEGANTTKNCIRKNVKPTRTLVMTSMPSENQSIIIQIVKRFGGFQFSDNVCETTTHVVAGHTRRTLNVLFGIARGCWILSFNWILWSLEQGCWAPEESFELSTAFPAATICRFERQSTKEPYLQDLFVNQPLIFISPQSKPPALALEKLVLLCGGQVCKTLRRTGICIGQYKGRRPAGNQHLSENWILDSITKHEVCSPDNYTLE
ncbi:microcephalin-like isoform X3 [Leucoraja erinacea]|uniref:microcephalin-like isoform X3 n=1 Tax=Leucoraja erinaceus TaxID=7782 RepID=UPI002455645C|nr:microcephalin-like isoform X3 [Leucoraja erinacea]